MNCRQDDSSPKSICSNCNAGSVAGGRKSTPTTRKPESIGNNRRPRFPKIPVTMMDGGPFPIYFCPGGGAVGAGVAAGSPGFFSVGGGGAAK